VAGGVGDRARGAVAYGDYAIIPLWEK
jgi:hypothetical protein